LALLPLMKILFIATNEGKGWGGSELLWSAAAEKLARSGNEVRVSVPDFAMQLPLVKRLQLAGCNIFSRDPHPSFISRLLRKLFPLSEYSLQHIRALGNSVHLVVISQGSNTDGLRWMESALAAGYRYVVIAHGAAVYWWPDDDLAEKLVQGYRNAVSAYFVSQATLDLTQRQFASSLHNAKVVRNPFNVPYDARPPWPADFSGGLLLACVGRLDVATKGHDILFQVLALPHWRSRQVKLSLVGNGPCERGLRRLANHLQLTNVQFLGHQNDMEQVWKAHHALVLASRFEGMPLTIVEAMLCGRPCIVSDVGGNRELVRDGMNGFLAKAPTVELLDEAMNRAWDSRSRLKGMGETAAADVRQWVSPDPADDFVRELLALFEVTSPK
jgi:glycosyltransferase involved in cell wall biosynthesis